MLGPNGAGKSTLLRAISGLVKPRHGSIRYKGQRIFTMMTVLENLMMGAFTRRDGKGVKEDFEFVFTLFPDLVQKKGQLGGELSGGQQQMLAIGRAFMSRPSLLVMDEPSLSLSPIMVDQLRRLGKKLVDIRQRLGMSILLVEQNAELAPGDYAPRLRDADWSSNPERLYPGSRLSSYARFIWAVSLPGGNVEQP